MKEIELSKIHNKILEVTEGSKDEDNIIRLSRSQILNPQNIYDHIYAILYKMYFLAKDMRVYNSIFMYDENNKISIKKHKRRLDKFNEGLKFTHHPAVFQEALYLSIIVKLHQIVDMLRLFCEKYLNEYVLNIEDEWKLPNKGNTKQGFNEYFYKEYKISRKLRNKYYVHEEMKYISEQDNIKFGYNKLVETVHRLFKYNREDYIEVVKESDIPINWDSQFFEFRVKE